MSSSLRRKTDGPVKGHTDEPSCSLTLVVARCDANRSLREKIEVCSTSISFNFLLLSSNEGKLGFTCGTLVANSRVIKQSNQNFSSGQPVFILVFFF